MKNTFTGYLMFDKNPDRAYAVEYTSSEAKVHFYRDDDEVEIIPVTTRKQIHDIFEQHGLDEEFFNNFMEYDVPHEDFQELKKNETFYQPNNPKYRLAYSEERSACQKVGNDEEKIQRRIEYFEMHLAALKEILEKKDFR